MDSVSEGIETTPISAREALEELRVSGLERVVAVKINGELKDLSARIDSEDHASQHFPRDGRSRKRAFPRRQSDHRPCH
jgi:hypothetical protein